MGLQARVRQDWTVDGLELEDTVAHFDTLQGETLVVPSNRTCVYAPRFAAARQVISLEQSEYRQLALDAQDLTIAEHQVAGDQPNTVNQPLATVRAIGVDMGRAVQEELPGRVADQVLQPFAQQDRGLPVQNEQMLPSLQLSETDRPWLAEGEAAAQVGSAVEMAQVVLDHVATDVERLVRGAEEALVYTTPTGAKLRLIKTASQRTAHSGDEIEFTLNFENVGQEEIGNVTLLDHLSHRLEYIPNSQTCSLDAQFDLDTQSRDGQTVRWEITQPIAPGRGGVITFKCRVR